MANLNNNFFKGNNNLKGNNRINSNNNKSKSNSSVLKILIIAVAFITLVFAGIMISIYLKTAKQNSIRGHVEEKLLDYMHDCKDNPLEIAGSKIPSSTIGNEYSLTFWIYIKDFTYRNGIKKQVLTKGLGGVNNKGVYERANPSVYLDEEINKMVFTFSLMGVGSQEPETESDLGPAPPPESFSGQYIIETFYDAHSKPYAEVELENLPLQRWNCINLTVYDNIIDIYIDGLLKKTNIIQEGVPKPNKEHIILGNIGGFDGYLSNISWSNRALSPKQIFNKYQEGPSVFLTVGDRMKNWIGKISPSFQIWSE